VAADAGADGDTSARALGRALDLRAALHAVFLAEAEGRPAPAAAAATLGAFVEQAAAHLTLTPERDTWSFRFARVEHPKSPLWPIAWDAARLLTSDDRPPVRRCANDRCRWLFLDESRRGNRRWCDMAVCGSRAKARTYYRRRKAETRFRVRAGRGSVERGLALLDKLDETEVPGSQGKVQSR